MSLGDTFKKVQSTFTSGGLNLLGGGATSGDSSGDAAAAEEARKAALRKKIDLLYGIGPTGSRPAATPAATGSGLFSGVVNRARDASLGAGVAYDADAQAADEARAAMEGENTKLADATRAYYTDELARQYAKAERNTRFALARQGLAGGSADADTQGEVSTDRNLGATRVDEAVRRAISGLTSQRESERLNAINLVNAGGGDSAVTAAQRGLTNAFDNVNTQQKANIFGDLFGSATDAVANSNLSSQQAAIAARYRDQLATFFPTKASSSGRITPSGG